MVRERKSTQLDTGRPPCDQPSSHLAGKTTLKFREERAFSAGEQSSMLCANVGDSVRQCLSAIPFPSGSSSLVYQRSGNFVYVAHWAFTVRVSLNPMS